MGDGKMEKSSSTGSHRSRWHFPMADATPRHIVDEQLDDPASYLTVAGGDRVYDL